MPKAEPLAILLPEESARYKSPGVDQISPKFIQATHKTQIWFTKTR
jgi:hypothetical protein